MELIMKIAAVMIAGGFIVCILGMLLILMVFFLEDVL